MRKYLLFCITIMMLVTARAGAQDMGYNERAKKYIDQYASLAIYEQKKSGIPASITLGQGILETEAGASELMTEANNHFGIKCRNGWQGPTYSHTDDAPDECFKKYSCAAESFSDHSALLKRNPRYAPLICLPQTDYAAWAKCLKKCGYATNPQYAERLIKIIEDFRLQEYTYTALDSSLRNNHNPDSTPVINAISVNDTVKKPFTVRDTIASVKKVAVTNPAMRIADSPRITNPHPAAVITQAAGKPMAHNDSVKNVTPHPANVAALPVTKSTVHPDSVKAIVNRPAPAAQPAVKPVTTPPVAVAEKSPVDESHIVIVNGLQAFYAYKDEMILQYAMKYHIGYRQLLAINDLADGPLPFNMYVYIERKLTKGTNSQHLVRDGESLFMAAQAEGMQLKVLRDMNLLNPNEEPIAGTVLELQHPAPRKPTVMINQMTAHTRNSIVMADEKTNTTSNDFIAIPKSKPNTFADTAKPHLVAAVNAPARDYTLNNTGLPAASPAKIKVNQADTLTKIQPSVKTEDISRIKDSLVKAEEHKIVASNLQALIAQANPTQGNTTGRTEKFYTVKKGDTAFNIARTNNITLEQLMKWNNMDGHITVGQNLQVKE